MSAPSSASTRQPTGTTGTSHVSSFPPLLQLSSLLVTLSYIFNLFSFFETERRALKQTDFYDFSPTSSMFLVYN
jgi:hypothetical protein